MATRKAPLWTARQDGFGEAPWTTSEVTFPAGTYSHPPSPTLQIRLIRRGSSYAEINLGRGRHRVFTRSGDVLVSLPGNATSFEIDAPREVLIIEVDGAFAAETLRQSGLGTPADIAPIAARPFRDTAIAALCRDVAAQGSSLVVRRWALQLLISKIAAVAHHRAERREARPLSTSQLAMILEALEKSPSDAHSNVTLARSVGMPMRAFGTAFRQATGLPVHQFVLRARADAAVKLLAETSLTLAEIAVRVGFSHQAHMTRVFSRIKGRTPGQYRARPRK